MRILHFIYDHPKNPWVGGGGAIRVEALARLMARKGHHVQLFSGSFPGCAATREKNLVWDFVGTAHGYVASTLTFAWSGARLARLQATGFDLIIEDFAPWNPLFTYRLRTLPAVVQVQNYFGRGILKKHSVLGWPFYTFEARYPKRFSHAIVINEALNRRFGIKGEVISMGIDRELLRTPEADGGYIAFLGRLDTYQKGLDILLDAAGRARLPVRVAGDGPGRESLMKQLAELPQVEWVGWLEGQAKVDHLRNATFVVVPSRFEGQNMVAIEAAALGKAVLVSDIEELRYVVDGGFGLCFRRGCADDLAAKMLALWEQEPLRRRLASNGRRSVENLTWPRLADRFEAFCMAVSKPNTV